MSPSEVELKQGAIFISDAHYSAQRPYLLDFLKSIHNKEYLPTQLILMGDIFDTLFGSIEKTQERNAKAISLINEIAQEIEVIYLEGNHDFNLKNIFPTIKVFPIDTQPILCSFETKKIMLAHGDFDAPFGYQIYTKIVRNKIVLNFLNVFDTYILKKLDNYLNKKDDCIELDWFEGFSKERIENTYDCDYFIEGHFHQNKTYFFKDINYINLGAFACNQRYFIVKSSKDKELLEEKIFSKET